MLGGADPNGVSNTLHECATPSLVHLLSAMLCTASVNWSERFVSPQSADMRSGTLVRSGQQYGVDSNLA